VTAVKRITLAIEDREFMVLVGPSGCGKSTTLRMIAGLEEISEGTGQDRGTIVNDVLPKDRDIAMVFQNYALYPHMTVYENMAFGLKLRKFPKADIDLRVREAATMLGLESYLGPQAEGPFRRQRQRWRSAGPSCASPRCSSLTSRFPTSTRRCACRQGPRSPSCTPASARR